MTPPDDTPGWEIVIEEGWPVEMPDVYSLALEVDPRARTVRIGPRVPGTGGIEVQSGALARSDLGCGEQWRFPAVRNTAGGTFRAP